MIGAMRNLLGAVVAIIHGDGQERPPNVDAPSKR